MLTALRTKTASWVAKIFIGILAFSFAVWGVSDIFGGYRGDIIATVGDREIHVDEYTSALDQRLRTISRQAGRIITREDAREFGIDRQVLGDLVRQAALSAQARKIGLSIPDDIIARSIVQNPMFQGADGTFSRRGFLQLLAANGLTEQQYVAFERDRLLRSAIASAVDRDLTLPETMLEAVFVHHNSTRKGLVLTIPRHAAGPVSEPGEDEIEEYYEANKRRFTAPEFRALTLLPVLPETIMSTVSVEEEDIRHIYETQPEAYSEPERRQVMQIAFPSREAALEAHERIMGGAGFDEIARERGLSEDDYSLGWVSLDEIPDTAVGEAAFALEVDTVSEPVDGRLSTVLLLVTDIREGETIPFEEVRDEIEQALQFERAQEEMLGFYDRVEDLRAGGATLREAADQLNLPLEQIDAIDERGHGPDGRPLEDIPALDQVVRAAFETDVGVENDPIQTADDGFIWYEVVSITPTVVRPLDDVRDDVIARIKATERRSLLRAKADEFIERAEDGESLDSLAGELGTMVNEIGPVSRGDRSAEISPATLAGLFSTRIDEYAVIFDQSADSYQIVRPTQVTIPDFDPAAREVRALAQTLTETMTDDLLGNFLAGLQEELGVSINNQVWARVHGERI